MTLKPIWTEGLLLSQHHFQQQDRYHERLLHERLRSTTHYEWGIIELRIDDAAIAAGQFLIHQLDAVWPDGLNIRCGSGQDDPAPAPRSFEALFPPEKAQLDVYVGLAAEDVTTASVATPEDNAPRRYLSTVRLVADVNSATDHQEVEAARPNLRLFFGNERQDGFLTIRIAELVRKSNGQPILRDTYVAPILHVQASPFLQARLRHTLSSVSSRQRELSADRHQRESKSVAFHTADARKFWLLHTLNGTLPVLAHVIETGRAHPEEVYILLAQLAGQLCTFAANSDPLSLPKFNYLALGDVFEELFARVLSLLSGGVEQTFTEVELERRKDGMFLGKFADPSLAQKELFVAVQSNLAESLVRERVPSLLKVASWNDIYDVVKQQKYGVRTEIEWNPSAALPLKPGVCFFRVRREGALWEAVAKSATVAMHLPIDADWSGVLLSLYAVDAKNLE